MVYFGYKERMINVAYTKKRIEGMNDTDLIGGYAFLQVRVTKKMYDLGKVPNELIKAENWFVDELVKRFNLDRETLEKLID